MSKCVFDIIAKHMQKPHISQYMHQASMHKHMSYQLVRPEFRGGEEVQSKNINQSDIIAALQNHGCQEQQAIDDQ